MHGAPFLWFGWPLPGGSFLIALVRMGGFQVKGGIDGSGAYGMWYAPGTVCRALSERYSVVMCIDHILSAGPP